MLSPPNLLLAQCANIVKQAGLAARHTTYKVRSGSIHHQSSLFLRIHPVNSSIPKRWFQHKTPPPSTPESPPKLPLSSKPNPSLQKDSDFVTKGDIPTQAEQRRSDWGITKRLLVNVWPKNDWKTRWIVLFGFGLLVSSKVSVLNFLESYESSSHPFLPVTQCASTPNIQEHRGLAQCGYNRVFYRLVTRRVVDPWV